MNMHDCLQAAIDAGQVSAELGKEAQKQYASRVREHESRGLPRGVAERQAGDDVAETISRGIKAERHTTAARLRIMQRNVERYSGEPLASVEQLRNDIQMVQSEWMAIRQQVFAGIHDFLKEHKTTIAGNVRNRALLKEVTQELHLEESGNPHAKAIAQSVLKQYERLRQLANSHGMDIGKLDDFGVPHSHHSDKILMAGYDNWFTKLYDGRLIDWSRIIDHNTGKPFAVASGARPLRKDADEFLKQVYSSITTNGWNNRKPSMAMTGKSLAKTRAEQRVLHFLNADAWMQYNDAFGRQNPFEAVITHISSMSRDIALMRGFGPSPEAGLNHAIQVIQKTFEADQKTVGPARKKMQDKLLAKTKRARVELSHVDGSVNDVESVFLATMGSTTRTLLVPAQLGSASLSTTVDWVSARSAAQAIGLNPNGATKAMMKQIFTGLKQDQARDLGFVLETWHDTMVGQAKLMADVWQPQLADRLASGVLRLSGLNYLTDSARVAMKMSFGNDMAALAEKAWDDLHPNMRSFMESRRITPADWDAMRDPSVIHTDSRGGKHINSKWFLEHTSLSREEAEDIAARWGGLVEEYAETAITTGNLKARSAWVRDTKAGTVSGEMMRSSGMYRGVALSRLFIFLRRFNEMDGGPTNRYLFAAKYTAMGIFAGAITLQMKAIIQGRDPLPMDDPKFWVAAMAQSGGLGIFGDFMFASTARTGQDALTTVTGPAIGAAIDLSVAVGSNASRLVQGKETLLGRDVSNIARRYNPLASLWYTRVAFNRLVWDQLQLALDPTAEVEMRKAEKRLRKEFGTQSWWEKGKTLPSRLPNLNNIASP